MIEFLISAVVILTITLVMTATIHWDEIKTHEREIDYLREDKASATSYKYSEEVHQQTRELLHALLRHLDLIYYYEETPKGPIIRKRKKGEIQPSSTTSISSVSSVSNSWLGYKPGQTLRMSF